MTHPKVFGNSPVLTNDAGLGIIKEFEGLRLEAYQDTGGVWTIGYGHTKTAKPGMIVTEEEAERLLKIDLAEAEEGVRRAIKVPITEDQFSALASFVFNIGIGQFTRSTLRKKINNNDVTASQEFDRWIYDNGRILNGLIRRRKAERSLYERSSTKTNSPSHIVSDRGRSTH